ncbi:transcriptional regulator [Laspinema olomoucense]|uniref:transcriptional regulator n=1 Tax=Laspinema olomoucense TaxID=3231600 RepID=UPI0021BAFC64|nr:transcriptional regulator [Laspinema sp. D3c]MCT7997376.1 transcriptional regulator [Laspinema sp. D3c]
MLTPETEILAILRNLPRPALEGVNLIASLRGKATWDMNTDDILNLTRGEE